MSTVKWTNPNNETQQYDIGTIGWELRRDNSLAGAFADIFRATYPLLPLSALFLAASVAMDPGSAVPTYGLWAGPGWNAGSRPSGGEIDWATPPCYNDSITTPNSNPDNCYSLVDAICKTHDWRYDQAEKQYAADLIDESGYKNAILQADKLLLQEIANALDTGSYTIPPEEDVPWDLKTFTGCTFDNTEKLYLSGLVPSFMAKIATVDIAGVISAEAKTAVNSILAYITIDEATFEDPTDPSKKTIYSVENGFLITRQESSSNINAWIMNLNDTSPSSKPANVNISYGEGSTKAEDTFVIGDGGRIRINAGTGSDEIKITRAQNDTNTTYTFEIAGGSGKDTYKLDSSFSYKLIDSGENAIFISDGNGKWLKIDTLYKVIDGTWKSEDGKITLTGKTITLANGSTITLDETFQSGDFGINLLTVPENPEWTTDAPVTNNTIAGDLQPIDFNPDPEVTEYHYDTWGNIIVDSSLAAPGRYDTLYDTPANDRISGGAGGDRINLSRGGDNWVFGGDGNDNINSTSATGNNIIDGGAGNDYIQANGGGNDSVLGGEGDDTIRAFNATGNIHIEGGGGDDLVITDNSGEAHVFGNAGNDLIDGNSTVNCLIEGGPGSDIIFGSYVGDNKLFGDVYGEMEQLIADGETAADNGLRGDLIAAGSTGGCNFIYGTNGYDILMAQNGNNLLVGGGGNDLILTDYEYNLVANSTNETYTWAFTIEIGSDADGSTIYTPVITGISGYSVGEVAGFDDVVYAGTGNDYVSTGGGDDEIYGGEGNDTIFGEAGSDFIEGGDGDDILGGDNKEIYLALNLHGNDYIDGGAGNDFITGDGGNDDLFGGDGNDTIYGGNGDDYLDGEAGDDTLYGQGGKDTLFGGDGRDLLDGGQDDDYLDGESGNDTLSGAAGADTLFGGDGDDILHGDAGNVAEADQGADYIDGEAGNDYIVGYGGNDTLYGGAGDDTIYGEKGDDIIDGGEGNNSLYGGEGNNEIYAGAGNDLIVAESGLDYIDAGDGNNSVFGGASDDTIFAGSGNDWLQGDAGADYIAGGAGNDSILGGGGQDTLYGSEGDDIVQGDAGDDYLDGGAGNDSMLGMDGNDEINGGDGFDTIWGGTGDDTIYGGAGNDNLLGEAGNDTYVFGRGDGVDTIENFSTDYASTTDIVQFGADIAISNLEFIRTGDDLQINIKETSDSLIIRNWYLGPDYKPDQFIFADSTVMTPAQIDTQGLSSRYGTEGNDNISGTAADDTIYGMAGDDTLYGYGGNNLLDGGAGNDLISGGASADTIMGGEGKDKLYGYAGNDYLDGGTGADAMYGGSGNDVYYVDNLEDGVIENSGEGIDTIYSSVSWTLSANVENLSLTGSEHINATGNGLDNVLSGNSGSNVLSGGAGNDTYQYGIGSNVDVINNYASDYAATTDTVKFGEGITAANLALVRQMDDLWINIAGTEDALIIKFWFYNDDYKVDQFVFADNTVLTSSQIEALGYVVSSDINGTPASEGLRGTDGDDHILGHGGDDSLYGDKGYIYINGGNDTLDGGPGNDYLEGDSGDDTYLFGRGSGSDTIYNYATDWDKFYPEDCVRFGEGITLDDLEASKDYSDLVISIKGTTDTLRFSYYFNNYFYSTGPYKVGRYEFADGTVLDQARFEGAMVHLTCYGTDNNDTIRGTYASETIYGYAGNDSLQGGYGGYAGNDALYGGDGDDTLNAICSESCTLDGGAGNDSLLGSVSSKDTYVFGHGYGQDTISNQSGYYNLSYADIIVFDSSVQKTEVAFVKSDDDLIISINGGSDTLTVQSWFTGYNTDIRFFDGTIWDAATITRMIPQSTEGDDEIFGSAEADVLSGLGGHDALYGYSGDDTIDGGAGNDYMDGGAGNDTYLFARGYGQDTINDYDTTTGNLDKILLGAGIASSDVTLTRNGDNLIVAINNTTDTATIQNWFVSTGANRVEQIVFESGTIWDEAYILANATTGGTSGNDNLTGTSGADLLSGLAGNDTLTGLAGDDTLDGGSGADSMAGGAGNDTYIVDNTGDKVTESSGAGTDTVLSNLTYTLGSNVENLTLTGSSAINGTGNTLDNYLTGNSAVNTLTGGSGNDTLDGGAGADSLVGGTGNDTYIVDNTGDKVTESSSAGTDTVLSSVTYTLSTNVEHLTLTGAADISGTGNSSANRITGNSGNNTLSGGSGADTLIGGNGNDTYVVDNTGDVVTENANEGTDLVQSSVTYTLSANVENLTLTGTSKINGTGNALDNYLTGNSAVNTLTGNAGNDTLDGGAGADSLVGGAGDDTYIVDNTGDVVTEFASEGIDTIKSSVTITLSDYVEHLTLTGSSAISATGNDLDNTLTGNSAANTITGNAGEDTLDGAGGNDALIGGSGNDTYLFGRGYGQDTIQDNDSTSGNLDTILLAADIAPADVSLRRSGDHLLLTISGSTDTLTVQNWFLSGGAYRVEQIIFAGASTLWDEAYILANATAGGTSGNDLLYGSSGPDHLSGLAGNDTLYGYDGDDTLDGGSGVDSMIGGNGNDTYIVDNVNDKITETSTGGTDTVLSSVTFTLPSYVEHLTLTGTATINATGNTLNNYLIGNSAANKLTGNSGNDTLDGGAGADSLVGGTGNDTYIVDNVNDKITETSTGGTDTVASSVTFTLPSYVEHLTLTGTSAINTTGNTSANSLTGNSSLNTLSGSSGNDTLDGGQGDDSLNGGSGSDTYLFRIGSGQDTVNNYDTSRNRIDTVRFDDVASTELRGVRRSGNDLIIEYGATDSIAIKNHYSGTSYQINRFTFSNGVTWTSAQLLSAYPAATASQPTGMMSASSVDFRETKSLDSAVLYQDTVFENGHRSTLDSLMDYMPAMKQIGYGSELGSSIRQFHDGTNRLNVSDGHYITRSDIEAIVNTMSSINNDAGMDVMTKYNAMMADQSYISTLVQTWKQM